jgi:hypothetical protein
MAEKKKMFTDDQALSIQAAATKLGNGDWMGAVNELVKDYMPSREDWVNYARPGDEVEELMGVIVLLELIMGAAKARISELEQPLLDIDRAEVAEIVKALEEDLKLV